MQPIRFLLGNLDDDPVLHGSACVPFVCLGVMGTFEGHAALRVIAIITEWAGLVDRNLLASRDCILQGLLGFEIDIGIHKVLFLGAELLTDHLKLACTPGVYAIGSSTRGWQPCFKCSIRFLFRL